MYKFEVLMSTYNGEKYIEEQIRSIFDQKGCNIHLTIRDDGSNDKTVSIIKKLSKVYDIDFRSGENLRPAKSFMNLVYNCKQARYYAFADQDDIWMDDKLIKAVELLNENNNDIPLMYCSNLCSVDSDGVILHDKILPDSIAIEYKQILSRCSDIFGCTMVWNDSLQRTILALNEPAKLAMHDYWVALIAASYGKILYDPEPGILYRQHGDNSVGDGKSIIKNWKGRLSWVFKKTKFSAEVTAKEMLNVYSQREVNIAYYQYTQMLANYKKSFKNKIMYVIYADMSKMSIKQKIFHVIMVFTNSL